MGMETSVWEDFAKPEVTEWRLLIKENIVNPLSWLLLARPEVPRVTQRIRKYVLNGDTSEAWRLKESYKDPLALEAISAAIIAQIAISMLALDNFSDIHWTATAFAHASMACGLLATFFSFYAQQVLSDLHAAEDVRDWLVTPRNNVTSRFTRYLRSRHSTRSIEEQEEDNVHDEKIPSLLAALTLTGPSTLLAHSILFLFTGLVIHLSCVYSMKLGGLKGSNANLNVLLFVLIVWGCTCFEVFLPLEIKRLTASWGGHKEQPRKLRNGGPNMKKVTAAVASDKPPAGRDVMYEALKASIQAQEESLKAQKAVLEFYSLPSDKLEGAQEALSTSPSVDETPRPVTPYLNH